MQSLGLETWADKPLTRRQSAALGAVIGILFGILVYLVL